MNKKIRNRFNKIIALLMAVCFIVSFFTTPIYASNEDIISPVLAVGLEHTLILRGDGTVWAVGRNDFGQLGDGTTTTVSKSTIVQVKGLSGIVQIAAGGYTSLALKNDGTVWAWGSNETWLLGMSGSLYSSVPVQIKGLDNVQSIQTNGDVVLALKSDGTLWGWGDNGSGELGNGKANFDPNPVPEPIPGMNNIKTFKTGAITSIDNVQSVAVGSGFTIALKKDGTVWGWGDNGSGKAVAQGYVYVTSPLMISGITDVVAIAAGNSQSLALKKDGSVWAWGDNKNGQLGTGSTDIQFNPVQVKGLSDVIAIAAGGDHNLALKRDGTVWAWGDNQYNQINLDGPAVISTPVQNNTLTHIISIIAGFAHSLALKDDGTVWTWGDNSMGQLGRGTNQKLVVPQQVPGMDHVAEIGAGFLSSVIRKQDGSVWSWGFNGNGQLGIGTLENQFSPIQSKISNQPVEHRINGQDRIETAIKVSEQGWINGTTNVILTRDDDFPDALAGATLANILNAPILLTNRSTLTPATEAEMKRLGASNVIILGGTGAVSSNIENDLKNKNLQVIRIGGRDRYDTAAQIALNINQILGPNRSTKVVLANGNGFADALAVSSWAAYNHVPILLTDAKQLPNATANALPSLGYPTVIAVGGTGVISESV